MSVPYLPLYVADYETDTLHLSLEEDGAYTRLLRLCWRTPGCSLPDDDAWIMRRLRVTEEDFRRVVRPIIDEFFVIQRGRIVSKRLRKEREKVDAISIKRSEAGKQGVRSKALKTTDNATSKRSSKRPAKRKHLELEPELEVREEPSSDLANAKSSSGPTTDSSAVEKAEPSSQPASSENELGPVPPMQGHGSSEDRFWHGVDILERRGIKRSMLVKTITLVEGDFDEGLAILLATTAAKDPKRYLGAVHRDRKAERAIEAEAELLAVPEPEDPTLPEWANNARAYGVQVHREGKYIRAGGELHEEEGSLVGH